MKPRNVLLLFILVIVASAAAMAQTTPITPATEATPSTPRTPATPRTWSVQPAEPMNFSFLFDGSSYMGIVPEDINKENMGRYGLNSPKGVGISQVSEGSPAEKAGLKKGDVILQFDGEAITSNRKLLRLIGEAAPGQTVRLTISRNGSDQHVSVTLAEREDRSRGLRAMTPEWRNIPQAPNAPQGPQVWGNAPEAFAYTFGSNRRIGITTTSLTKQLADYFDVSGGHGLMITSVSENSPASKAGLKAGDVVTEINGEKLEDTDDFIRALNRRDDGEVTLTIIRDKSRRTIKVTPEKRPAPSFNLSELQSLPSLNRMVVPRNLMKLQNFKIAPFPSFQNFVLPKMDKLIVPRVITLPRIESLMRSGVVDYE